jgi:acyl-CoA synthetase (AMP-forming)/AMP-acid ligase II
MNIGEALPRNAQRTPNKLAIVDRRRYLTFLEFHQRVNRLARYLRQQGLGKGDLVALSCGSAPSTLEALFALGKIGALAVPFDSTGAPENARLWTASSSPRRLFSKAARKPIAVRSRARRVDAQAAYHRRFQTLPVRPTRRRSTEQPG